MLTIKDVSNSLNVSDRTVRRLIDSGQLRAAKIGGSVRIDEQELRAYIGRSTVRAKAAEPVVQIAPPRRKKSNTASPAVYVPGMRVV